MRSRERPVLPRFHGVLKTQPKATEIKVTFVQLCVGGGAVCRRPTLSLRQSCGVCGCSLCYLPSTGKSGEEGAGAAPVGITQPPETL